MSSSTGAHADAPRRILVLAPTGGDGAAVAHVLSDAGFESHLCADIGALAAEFVREGAGGAGGAGAAVIAQEALIAQDGAARDQLSRALADQPRWSDLPVILLATNAAGEDWSWRIARALDPLGNVTILERPLRRTTLLNAVAVALRARTRQYELRDMLRELDEHRERLRQMVEAKTSELTESMARLHAAERLASLGTLAAGLGHDLANLTLPIRMRIDTLWQAVDSDDARGDLTAIRQALTHLGHLSAGMRLMAMDPGREGATTAAIDLTEWAAETTPMLNAALPRSVRLECDIAPNLGVKMPRHQLAQAVFNLVQNAGEAMASQREGLVRVTARAHEPASASEQPMVQLLVSDNGPGMPPAVLARCFEPYFTTKGRAIATGMGLGMVKGMVESAGGGVTVESSVGVGTTFTIVLPSAKQAATPEAPPSPAPRVSVIDLADKRMASLVSMLLEQLEYRTERHAAATPPDASLWVLDRPTLPSITEFLGQDPERRVLVLTSDNGAAASAAAAVGGLEPELAGRVVMLPRSSPARTLRDALAACRNAVPSGGDGS